MNKNKLYFEMKEKGVSVSEMCEALEMSRSAFYRKCNGVSEFTLGEAEKIVEYLGLKNLTQIFFDQEMS